MNNAVKIFTATVLATIAKMLRTLLRNTTQFALYCGSYSTPCPQLQAVAFRILARNTTAPAIAGNCTSALPVATVVATFFGGVL